MATFEIGETDFLLDGRPHRILSGAMHYFRVHPDQWAHRIAQAKAMGLNTIETYVAWNAHAPRRGEFRLDGGLDLGRYLDLIAEAGMHAIVRPGPYICAEWAGGGLPAWLFGDAPAGIRRSDAAYLAAVDEFLDALGPVLAPRQIDRGGPIVLVQIENEFGAYGDDPEYLDHLVEATRRIGITVPFITVDQPTDEMLRAGSRPGLHKTGSFGGNVAERLETLRRHQPTGPLMCTEFWIGWFDHWGEHHHTTSAERAAADLEKLLAAGASVNIYMFHGGTNFGFTNGANNKGVYRSIVTSYDYDAPLDEAGNPTAKYHAFRDVLRRYTGDLPDPLPAPASFSEAEAAFTRSVGLWDAVTLTPAGAPTSAPVTLDEIGQENGFAVYSCPLPERPRPVRLDIGEVRDRALVFVDGAQVGVLARDHHDTTVTLPAGPPGELRLLVEDLGRVNYGPRLGEPKGLIGTVSLDGASLEGWTIAPVPLGSIGPIEDLLAAADDAAAAGPAFALAEFDLPAGASGDLLLSTRGWGKGVAWLNDFCLGRFWSRGPQRTLYVPGPVVQATGNRLVVLDLTGAPDRARFVAQPDLGPLED